MSDVYTTSVETSTTRMKGRAITRVRDRNFLVDDPASPFYDNGPGEELGASELFAAGISTCAALMIERIARAKEIAYGGVTVQVTVARDMVVERPRGPQALDSARVHFVWHGITGEDAAYLTDAFANRCPLYGSVVIATPDTVLTHEVVG